MARTTGNSNQSNSVEFKWGDWVTAKAAGRYVRESDYLALMHDKLAIEGRVNQLVDNYNVLQLKDQNNEAAIAAYIATIEKLQAQRDELLGAAKLFAKYADNSVCPEEYDNIVAAIRRVEEGR